MKKYLNILNKLSRFRLSAMVSFSASVGYFLFHNFEPLSFTGLLAGVFFLASGTSALNQIQERNYDRLMRRTAKRPIPSGQVNLTQAWFITFALLLLGCVSLLLVGIIPLLLGLSNLFFYNLLYTKLKRISTFAVLPGSIVGAIPPLMGWTAAGGQLFDKPAMFIAFFMFLWQVPHFWLLLLYFKNDYTQAGFKNLTDTLDVFQVKRLTFLWALLTSLFLLLFPVFFDSVSILVLSLLLALNITFIYLFHRFLLKPETQNLRMAFLTINLYMPMVLIVLVLFIG